MSFAVQRAMAWSGLAVVFFAATGFLLAGLLPVPPGADLDPGQIAEFYSAHPTATRLGFMLTSVGVCAMAPLTALIGIQMLRIKEAPAALALLQVIGGTGVLIMTVIPTIIMNVAAFRPDRNPVVTQAINDLAWLLFITPVGLFFLQDLPIAAAILLDRSRHPVFPRWVGYANLWIPLSFLPATLPYFAKTGPVAWQGVLVFYLGLTAFGAWILIMVWASLRAIRQQTEEPNAVLPDPGTSTTHTVTGTNTGDVIPGA